MKEQFRTKKFTGNIRLSYQIEEGGVKVKKLWECNQQELIQRILVLVREYQEQNIIQTLRGYYYDLLPSIPNAIAVYKRIGKLVSDLRYAGLLDWSAMEDRARKVEIPLEFENLKERVDLAIHNFRLPRWSNQDKYIELVSEKDTMYSRLAPLTNKYHIPLCINRGYASSSVVYDLSKRLIENLEGGKEVVLLYVGDHDASGLDMIRDIEKRLTEFLEDGREYIEPNFKIVHVTLTKEQIKKYKLPPNPAKLSDTRAKAYIKEHGNISWEVDAMKPQIMREIVELEIQKHIDVDKYNAWIKREDKEKKALEVFADKLSKKA